MQAPGIHSNGELRILLCRGLLCRLAKQTPGQKLTPGELQAFLHRLLDTYQPQNDQESYLMQMLKTYKVSDEYDEQMPQLLQMGLMDQ